MSPNRILQSANGRREGAGYRSDHAGWIYLHIAGLPYDRGWHHGFLLANEIRAALQSIAELLWQDTGLPFNWYAANARAMWLARLSSDDDGKLTDSSGSAAIAELNGIVAGANANRSDGEKLISIDDLLGWNGYPEMICQWLPAVMSGAVKPAVPVPGDANLLERIIRNARFRHSNFFQPHHCSAFVATGDWTSDGRVVSAHTTWQRFANGDFYNLLIHLEPPTEEGFSILMQSVPGYIASSMDFGTNAAGVIVSSTSINAGGFDPSGLPYFLRARRAGQRADTIEKWIELFKEGNNGGYANTWLLAESKTSRIAAYELTITHEELQEPVKSGYYCSCNIPLSVPIRVLDTGGSGFDNVLQSGSRRIRFEQLMAKYKGSLDASSAQSIIADHHDLYTGADLPSGRTICGHFDNDAGALGGGHGPFYPWGSLDGKVVTGDLASSLSMRGRWGRACGTPFDATSFFSKRPQYDWMRALTSDRKPQPWCLFRPHEAPEDVINSV
jgi:hypothetical protein